MPAKNRRSVLFGEALRQARKAAGISQEELAFEAKLDRTYVSQLENGHKSPTVEVLFRLAPVLGMAASELIAQVERSLQSRRK
jgi:transcriptional regulator with XRE-family HTH domain